MSGATRLGLVAAAVLVAVVAFVLLRQADDDDAGPDLPPDLPAQRAEPGSRPALPVLRSGAVRTIEVQRGDRVRFVVRSPEADEAHVHGYDLLKRFGPAAACGAASRPSSMASTRSSWSGRGSRSGSGGEAMRRLGLAVAAAMSASLLLAGNAWAHGLAGRADLPIPEWLFAWAAVLVLVVSFVALALLWPEPRLQGDSWRPLPGGVGRALASRPVEVVCGAVGVFLLGLVVYAGLRGTQSATANFAPTFVYVIFWLGLVAASVLFGDVFRAFNPWRAIGRTVAWLVRTASRAELPAPLPYPERLGRWPAAAGIFAFAVMELVASNGDQPRALAIAVLVYSALTFVAMALYGVERWLERGEAYSVYFNLFSRISPLESRDGELGLRKPLSGLARLEPLPGTIALLAVMIGSVTFDGAAEAPLWSGLVPDIAGFFEDIGLSQRRALEATFMVGLVGAILLVAGFYRLGIAGARSVGGGFSADRLAGEFVHSLIPIALAYVAAHYFTLLLFQGQAMAYLVSDPLGDGSDLFGTADAQIDYGLIGANATWYWQVAFVVAGHVAALTLAHDRAVALYDDARLAVRSQYWMLAVMVGFTSLALWLLSQANA